jgi:hypothetical protein
MAELARQAVEVDDFPGMVTNMDDMDLPKGAASAQVNACSQKPGVLTVRLGYLKVAFEND